MWYQESIDKLYTSPQPITVDGITMNSNIFKHPTELTQLGIFPAEMQQVDERYYIRGAQTKTFEGDMWIISWEQTQKPLEELRSELVKYWLEYLDQTLVSTDKYLTRKDELDQWFSKWNINPQLQDWRDGVYLLFNTRMNSVTEAVTFEGLMLADEQPFTVPSQPNPFEVEG